jgi:hypothetical protein
MFTLLAIGGGGLTDPLWAGCFWLLLGVSIAATGVQTVPEKLIFLFALLWFLSSLLVLLPFPLVFMASSGIPGLAPRITPQPSIHLQYLGMFAGGLIWAGWLLGNPVGENQRLSILRWTGITVALLGMVALLSKIQKWPLPLLPTEVEEFGFFPNRNHMSNWLALGGMAAAGALFGDIRKGRWPLAMLSLLAIPAIMTCLAANTSRGGLLVFFLGLLVWTVALVWAGPDRKIGLALLALLLVAATSLLFSGGKSLDRLRPETKNPVPTKSAGLPLPNPNWTPLTPEDSEEGKLAADARLRIFLDTWDMVKSSPWTGVGLGNFRYLFPRFRTRSFEIQSEALHPESDVLWIAAESGLPALLFAAALVILLFHNAAPGANREGWATRAAAASGVLAFLLHGFVDVPGHRPGVLALALLLAWLAFARKSRDTAAPASWRFGFRIAGGGLAVFGAVWAWGVLHNWDWPPSPRAATLRQTSLELLYRGEVEASLAAAERAVRLVPLDRESRFLEGASLLSFEDGEKKALSDFAMERWLEPYRVRVPVAQAYMLAAVDPNLASGLYREALERADRFPPDSRQMEFVVEQMVARGRELPNFRPRIPELLEGRTALQPFYLNSLSSTEYPVALEQLLLINPSLEGWPPTARLQLFISWARRGEAGTLLPVLEKNSTWWDAGWPVLVQLWAKAGRTQEALELAEKYLPAPALPEDSVPANQAESRWYRSPRDYGAAFVLAETRRKNGDLVGARVVLEKITERPEAPAYFWWLRSRVETEEGRFAPAWESLKKYLQRADPAWPTV